MIIGNFVFFKKLPAKVTPSLLFWLNNFRKVFDKLSTEIKFVVVPSL